MSGNNQAAKLANIALQAYAEASGDPQSQVSENWCLDLIASLRHLADARGWDFTRLDAAAFDVYRSEIVTYGAATAADD